MSCKLYTNNNNRKWNNGWIQYNGSQTKETSRRMSMGAEYLRVYLWVEVQGWTQLVNGGRNGDTIREERWGRRWCGGIYGVSARWSLSGVVMWTYSVWDVGAWRCPLTMPWCIITHLSASLGLQMASVPQFWSLSTLEQWRSPGADLTIMRHLAKCLSQISVLIN